MSDTQTIRSAEFTASRAWGALDIANMNGTTVRLHWTDQPYKWHVNDGEEVFAVMDGEVDMHYRGKRRRTHRSVEKRRHLLRRNRYGTRRPSMRRSADFGDRERRQCLRSSEKKTIQVVGRILVSDMKKKIVQRVGFGESTYGWKIRQN